MKNERLVLEVLIGIKIYKDIQIGFIAINTAGEVGAFAIHKGFNYTLFKDAKTELIEAGYYLK